VNPFVHPSVRTLHQQKNKNYNLKQSPKRIEMIKCRGCKYLRMEDEFDVFKSIRRKTCMVCKENRIKKHCQHNREKEKCKECFGNQICCHQRERSKCKLCGGGSICCHLTERSKCKLCHGGSICMHQKRKTKCKECNLINTLSSSVQ
jgi:hypothetical protein